MKTKPFLIFLTIFFTVSGFSVDDILDDSSSGGGSSATTSCGTMNELSCQMHKAVNTYRVSSGRAALEVSLDCTRLAQDHAVDMVVRDFFSHNSPTETFQQRAARYGLSFYVGENIAMGSDDVETILTMWQNSPGHNNNMLNSTYRSGGVGYYQGRWVQCFSGAAE
jgi:uncharacterized protein YkwD